MAKNSPMKDGYLEKCKNDYEKSLVNLFFDRIWLQYICSIYPKISWYCFLAFLAMFLFNGGFTIQVLIVIYWIAGSIYRDKYLEYREIGYRFWGNIVEYKLK